MKKSMLAIHVATLAFSSPIRWVPSEIFPPTLLSGNGYPPSTGKAGIAAAKRAAKKRRRAK